MSFCLLCYIGSIFVVLTGKDKDKTDMGTRRAGKYLCLTGSLEAIAATSVGTPSKA